MATIGPSCYLALHTRWNVVGITTSAFTVTQPMVGDACEDCRVPRWVSPLFCPLFLSFFEGLAEDDARLSAPA